MKSKRIFEKMMYHQGFSVSDLRKAFNAICNPENWKNPLETVIDTCDFDICAAAVEYFTGSKLVKIGWDVNSTDRVIVQADGYYAACGA